MENGIVIDGKVQPGTEWVLRDEEAWWKNGEYGTRPRHAPASVLVGHWTAGRPLTGELAARTVVRNMRSRKRTDGSPLEVAIHFVVSWDGLVFQTADLSVASVHVGNRDTILRSIGVETTWPGTIRQAQKVSAPDAVPVDYVVAGENVRVMKPSTELLGAWVKLADTLASLRILDIPRRVPSTSGAVRRTRFTQAEAGAWKGAQEHFHLPPPTTKIDAAGVLMQALADAGWAHG